MPALITHDTFGQDVYADSFRTIGGSRDEAEAFLLGNQGPDPLFYAVISPRLHAHTRLGNTMHAEKPAELLKALKDSLSILNDDERPVGRAYALGFLCHYILDSTVHPLVYFHEYRLCDAGEPGLSRDDGSEVHAIIESELDELVLFTKRGETIETFDPSREVLKASDSVLRIVSKMYASIALTVYGELIPADLFAKSVRNFRRTQRVLHSPMGAKRALIGRVERLARPHSFLQAMSHRPVELEASAFDNRNREPWTDPFTKTEHTASFWDLYDTARTRAQEVMAAFDADTFTVEKARDITRDRDFSGRPCEAMLIEVRPGETEAEDVKATGADKTADANKTDKAGGTGCGAAQPTA